MTHKASKTVSDGVITFTIHTHDERPQWVARISDYSSGKQIKDAFHEWAAQYGGAQLEP